MIIESLFVNKDGNRLSLWLTPRIPFNYCNLNKTNYLCQPFVFCQSRKVDQIEGSVKLLVCIIQVIKNNVHNLNALLCQQSKTHKKLLGANKTSFLHASQHSQASSVSITGFSFSTISSRPYLLRS